MNTASSGGTSARFPICTLSSASSTGTSPGRTSQPRIFIGNLKIPVVRTVDLLILDEWLVSPLNDAAARDLLEIVEARYQLGSIIFCSQFAPSEWHDRINEGTLSEAILDRIKHNAYSIIIDGKVSM